MIEQQSILAPAREPVQGEADAPQQRLALDEIAAFALGEKAVPDKPCPTRSCRVSAAKWRLATQPIIWMSRSPPGFSLMLGSRL